MQKKRFAHNQVNTNIAVLVKLVLSIPFSSDSYGNGTYMAALPICFYNYRIIRVGRDLKDHLIPILLPEAGTPPTRSDSLEPSPAIPEMGCP